MFKKFKLFSLVILIVAVSTALLSAEKTDATNKKVEAVKVVVTGTKTERLLRDVPIKTSVISKKDIEKKGAKNLYEALDGAPGVRVEEQCQYCNFSMVRINGMSSGHTLVLIDGEPVYTGLAGVYGLQQIQSGNIERIEIVKGGGSSLYGSDAVAGVINIITEEPKPGESHYEISSTYGSYNEGAFSVLASKRSENIGGVISIQKSIQGSVDMDKDLYTDQVETDNVGGVGKLYLYNPLSFIDLFTVTGKILSEFRRGGDLRGNNWDNPFALSSEHIKTVRHELGFELNKYFSLQRNISITFNYSHHKRDATNDAAISEILDNVGSITNADDLPFPFIANEKIYISEAKYLFPFKLAGKHSFLIGIQHRRSDFSQIIGQRITGTRMKTTKKADDLGGYLQDEYSPAKRLTIIAGARYDYHNSVEHYNIGDNKYKTTSLNPRGSIKYDISKKLAFRGSVGKGFRVPYHFDEDLHLCSGSPKIAKPSNLKPETSMSYTASLDFEKDCGFGKRYIDLTYTLIDVKDKIEFVPTDIPDYDYEWRNMEDAITHSIEITFGGPFPLAKMIKPFRIINIELNYAYINAQYKKNPYDEFDSEVWGTNAAATNAWKDYKDVGKYIARSPFHTGSISLDFTPGTWSFNITGKYTGYMYIEYYKDDEFLTEIKKTAPFWITDVRISKKFNNLEIFAGAKNLFDYWQHDRRPDNAAFIWAPLIGRKIYGGMKLKI